MISSAIQRSENPIEVHPFCRLESHVRFPKLLAGEALPNFTRGGLADGFVKMSPLGPAVSAAARTQFDGTLADMMKGGFSVIKGPLKNNKGDVVVAEGKAFAETAIELESMDYLVDGVVGSTS